MQDIFLIGWLSSGSVIASSVSSNLFQNCVEFLCSAASVWWERMCYLAFLSRKGKKGRRRGDRWLFILYSEVQQAKAGASMINVFSKPVWEGKK